MFPEINSINVLSPSTRESNNRSWFDKPCVSLDKETTRKATKDVNDKANIDHFLPKKRKYAKSSCEVHHKLFVKVMSSCESKKKELMNFVKSKLNEMRIESLKRATDTSPSNAIDRSTSNSATSKKSKKSSPNKKKVIYSLNKTEKSGNRKKNILIFLFHTSSSLLGAFCRELSL